LATGIICTYAPVFWTKGGVHHSGTAFLKPDVKPLTAKLPHYIAVASSTWEHGVVETVRLRGGRNEHLFAVLDFTKASRKHLSDRQRVAAGDYPEPGEYYKEGSARVFVGNAYERDTAAREACIRQQGYICAVCGFDFARTYGNLGANFIHVHHESPLSVGPRLTAPSRDLTPVCANCHAIVHRRRQIVSVKALKKVVQGLRRGRSSKGA
jgi:predicted HNH restriction endonuclease